MKGLSLLKVIKEDVIGTENTFFGWSIIGAVGLIFSVGFYLSLPNLSFHGLASAREIVVNFESPVEISRVHVVQGQKVKKGELLIELSATELNTRIRELSAQVERLKAEVNVRDEMNKSVGNSRGEIESDPLMVELRDGQVELSELLRQRNGLHVFAEIDGVVGSVHFMKGQRVPAFAPVLTLSALSPTFVEGYVPENLRTSLKIGSSVKVSSITGGGSVIGKVVGIGARYVVIPSRLVPEARGIELWGREVLIEIPVGSQLLLAERVLISPNIFVLPSLVETAASEPALAVDDPSGVKPVVMPAGLAAKSAMEASGVVYLQDLKRYLLVSDDTDASDSPWLFLMSADGQVDEQPLVIPGVDKLKDIESVSSEGDLIYVLTSLQTDKSGGNKAKANSFLRMRRQGLNLGDTQSVNLGKLLRRKVSQSTDPLLKELGAKLSLFDVEAHALKDGDLYVALKNPRLRSNESVILRLSTVEILFSAQPEAVTVQVWSTVAIPEVFSRSQHISDMVFTGEDLLLATTCGGAACGALWRLDGVGAVPSRIQTFDRDPPEGIAYDFATGELLVTFDLGAKGSKFTTLAIPPTTH